MSHSLDRKHRRFSFSLKTLTCLVFASCLLFSFIAIKNIRVQKQRAVVKRIEAAGGEVFHTHIVERREPKAPKWLLEKMSIDSFEGLGQIQLQKTEISDISFLSELSGVQRLYLDRTRVSSLEPIASMESLTLLSLDHTPVTDLTPISGLSSLEILSISDTAVSDLRPLHKLENLKMLYARRTSAADEDFEALQAVLPNCKIER